MSQVPAPNPDASADNESDGSSQAENFEGPVDGAVIITAPRLGSKPSTTYNMISNAVAQGWQLILSLVFAPIFIHLIGIEAYGVIGFLITLQGLLRFLDLGLTPAINRQMAIFRSTDHTASDEPSFVHTFMLIFLGLGLLVGILFAILSGPISRYWLNSGLLGNASLQRSLFLMAIIGGLQWPISFFHGCVMGLERQVIYNIYKVISATGTYLGGMALVIYVFRGVDGLLCAQILFDVLLLIALGLTVRTSLPRATTPPAFSLSHIRTIRKFAVGMGAITLASLILTQFDKLFLSKWLTLTAFSYYMLATSVSSGVSSLIVTPLFTTIFPRFSAIVISNDATDIRTTYRTAAEVMTILLVTPSVIAMLYSHQLLTLWLRDSVLAAHVAPIVTILLIGTVLNGLMNVPYAFQLAIGRTDIPIKCNVVTAIVAIAFYIVLIPKFGYLGAASSWCCAMCCYNILSLHYMRTLLPGETFDWLVYDTLIPSAISVLITVFFYFALARSLRPIPALGVAFLSGVCAIAASIAVCPNLQREALRHFNSDQPIV